MKFPIGPDTPDEWQLAHAIAAELMIEGFDGGLALPFAIHLMSIIDAGHDDPKIAVEKLKQDRIKTDKWWVQNWPDSNFAKAAKERLAPNLPEKPKPPGILTLKEGSQKRFCNKCLVAIPWDTYSGLCRACENAASEN